MKPGNPRPLMIKAHGAVSAAIAKGTLTPASQHDCVDCGVQATRYDHRDYNKPLAVEPVCHRCNCRRGPGAPYIRESRGFNGLVIPIWMPEIAI